MTEVNVVNSSVGSGPSSKTKDNAAKANALMAFAGVVSSYLDDVQKNYDANREQDLENEVSVRNAKREEAIAEEVASEDDRSANDNPGKAAAVNGSAEGVGLPVGTSAIKA